MRAILEAAGLAAHVYTSPHLVRFHERIRIGADRRRALRARGPARRRPRALRGGQRGRADHGVRDHHGGRPAAVLRAARRRAAAGGRARRPGRRHQRDRHGPPPPSSRRSGATMPSISATPSRPSPRRRPASSSAAARPIIAAQDYAEADAVLCRLAEAARRHADPRRRPGFLGPCRARPPRLPGRDRPVRPADAAPDRPPPVHQCRHRHRGPAGGRLRRYRHRRHRGRPAQRRLARTPAAARTAGACPTSCRRAPSSGSTAATTSTAAASSPPPWRISASARDVPLVLIVGLLGTKDAEGFLRNFVGLARVLIAVPIAGQMAARPAEEVAQHRGGGRSERAGRAERRGRAREPGRHRVRAAAAHPDLRLALPGGRGPDRERHAADLISPSDCPSPFAVRSRPRQLCCVTLDATSWLWKLQ